MENTTTIKRYSNRKLYCTKSSKYVTLVDIKNRLQEGELFTCVDNKTKSDITNYMLKQVLTTKALTNDKLLSLIVNG